eukprot:TRINITY_DN4498_c0_g1_i4.p1 TRINITY_DN4498_c0_g1~~TRINITY_DN4498_c0_g1_i4.p1  ORF type:complete len:3013 (+),score=660.01 TRINITY_DN4498_c0_g1_i4:68-9106(+)
MAALPVRALLAILGIAGVQADLYYARLNQHSAGTDMLVTKQYYGEVWVDAAAGKGLRLTVSHNIPIDPRCSEAQYLGKCMYLHNTDEDVKYYPTFPLERLTNLMEHQYPDNASGLPLLDTSVMTPRYFHLDTDVPLLNSGKFKVVVLDDVDAGTGISGVVVPTSEEVEVVNVQSSEFSVQLEVFPTLRLVRFSFKISDQLRSDPASSNIFKLKIEGKSVEDVVTFDVTSHPSSVTEGSFAAYSADQVFVKQTGRYVVTYGSGKVADAVPPPSVPAEYFEMRSVVQTQQIAGYLKELQAAQPVAVLGDGIGELAFFASYNTTTKSIKMRYEIIKSVSTFETVDRYYVTISTGRAFVQAAVGPVVGVLGGGWVWFGENTSGVGEPDPVLADAFLSALMTERLYLTVLETTTGPELYRGQLSLVTDNAASRTAELHSYSRDAADNEVLWDVPATDPSSYEHPFGGLLRVRSFGDSLWGVVEGFRTSPFANDTFPDPLKAGTFDTDVVAQLLLDGRPIAVGGMGGWERIGGLIRFSLFERSANGLEGKIGRKNLGALPAEKKNSYGVRGMLEDYAVCGFSAHLASNTDVGYFTAEVTKPAGQTQITWNLTHTLQGLDGGAACDRDFSCLVLVRGTTVVANLLRGRHSGPASAAPLAGTVVLDDIDTEIKTETKATFPSLHLNTVTLDYTLDHLARDIMRGEISVTLLTAEYNDVKTGGYFTSRLGPAEPPRGLEIRSSVTVGRLGLLMSTLQLQYDVAAAQNSESTQDNLLQKDVLLGVMKDGGRLMHSLNRDDVNKRNVAVGAASFANTATNNKVYKGTTKPLPFYVVRGLLGATQAQVIVTRKGRSTGTAVQEMLQVIPVSARALQFYNRMLWGGGAIRASDSSQTSGVDVFWRGSVNTTDLTLKYTCAGCGSDSMLSEPTGVTPALRQGRGVAGSNLPYLNFETLIFAEGDGNVTLTPRLLHDIRAGWRTMRYIGDPAYATRTSPILADEPVDQFSALLLPSAELSSAQGTGSEGLAYFAEVEMSLSVHPSSGLIEHTLVIPSSVRCVQECMVSTVNGTFGSFQVTNPIYAASGSTYQTHFEHVLPVGDMQIAVRPPLSACFMLKLLRARVVSSADLAQSPGVKPEDFDGIPLQVDAVYPGVLAGSLRKTWRDVASMSCAGNKGQMQGLQVVPPVESSYTGSVSLNLDLQSRKLTAVSVSNNVPQVKGMFLGIGRIGQAGDLRTVIKPGDTISTEVDTERALVSGFAFAVVIPIHHNAETGEIRCQLLPTPEVSAVTNKKNLYVDTFSASDKLQQDSKGLYTPDEGGALGVVPWISLLWLYPSGLMLYQINTLSPPQTRGQITLCVDPNADATSKDTGSRIEVGSNAQLAQLTRRGSVEADLKNQLNQTWGSVVHVYPWEAVLMRKSTLVKFNVTTERYPGGEISGTVRSSSEGSIFTTMWQSVNYNPVYEDIKIDFVVSDMVTPFFFGINTEDVGVAVMCDGVSLMAKLPVKASAGLLHCLRSGLSTVVITNTTVSGGTETFTGVIVPDDVAPIYNFETNLDSGYLAPNSVGADSTGSDPAIKGRVITQIVYASTIIVHLVFNYDFKSDKQGELACDLQSCGDSRKKQLSCINFYSSDFLYSQTGAGYASSTFDVCNPLFSVPTVKPLQPLGDRNTKINPDVLNSIPSGGFLSVTVEGSANDEGGVLGMALQILAERSYVLFHSKSFSAGAARADVYRVSPLSNLGFYNSTTDALTDIKFSSRPTVTAGSNTTKLIKLSYNRLTKRLYSDFCMPRDTAADVYGGSNNGCVFSYITLFGGGRSNMTNVLLGEFPNKMQVGSTRPEGGYLFYSGDTVSETLISAMVTGRLQVAGNAILDSSATQATRTLWMDVHVFRKEAFSWIYLEEPVDYFGSQAAPAYLPIPLASYARSLVAFYYHPSSFMLRYDIFVDSSLVGKRCYGAGCVVLQSTTTVRGTDLPIYSVKLLDLYDFTPLVTMGGGNGFNNRQTTSRTTESLRSEYHGFIPASSHVLNMLYNGEMTFLLSDAAKGFVAHPASESFAGTTTPTQQNVAFRALLDPNQLRVMVDTRSLSQSSTDKGSGMPGVFEETGLGYAEVSFADKSRTVADVTVRHNMKLGSCPLAQQIGCVQLRVAPFGEDGSIGAVIHNAANTDAPLAFRTKPLPLSASRAVLNGWAYLNVYTIKTPTGAVRGQLLPYTPPIVSFFEHTLQQSLDGDRNYIVQTHIRVTATGAGCVARVQILTNYTVPAVFSTSDENRMVATKEKDYDVTKPLLRATWSLPSGDIELDVNRPVSHVFIEAQSAFFLLGNTSKVVVVMKGWSNEEVFRTVEQTLQDRLCKDKCNDFFAELHTYNTQPSASQNCETLDKATCGAREVCTYTGSTCKDTEGFMSATYDDATKSLAYTLSYERNTTYPPPATSCVENPATPGCAFLQLGTPGIRQVETRLLDTWTQTRARPSSALQGFSGSVRLSGTESWALRHGGLNVRVSGGAGKELLRASLLPAPLFTVGDLQTKMASRVPGTYADLYSAVRGVKYPLDGGVLMFTSQFAKDPEEGFFYAEFLPGTGDLQGVGILRYAVKHVSIPKECQAATGCLTLTFTQSGYTFKDNLVLDYGRAREIPGQEGTRRIVQGEVEITGDMLLILGMDQSGSQSEGVTSKVVVSDSLGRPQDDGSVTLEVTGSSQSPDMSTSLPVTGQETLPPPLSRDEEEVVEKDWFWVVLLCVGLCLCVAGLLIWWRYKQVNGDKKQPLEHSLIPQRELSQHNEGEAPGFGSFQSAHPQKAPAPVPGLAGAAAGPQFASEGERAVFEDAPMKQAPPERSYGGESVTLLGGGHPNDVVIDPYKSEDECETTLPFGSTPGSSGVDGRGASVRSRYAGDEALPEGLPQIGYDGRVHSTGGTRQSPPSSSLRSRPDALPGISPDADLGYSPHLFNPSGASPQVDLAFGQAAHVAAPNPLGGDALGYSTMTRSLDETQPVEHMRAELDFRNEMLTHTEQENQRLMAVLDAANQGHDIATLL